MAFGTLFTKSDHPRSTAIKAVAKANGLDLKIVEVEFEEARTAEHLKASPLGKIPAFAGEDGFQLSETIAIAIYITSQNEKTTLLGKTKQDYASILRWMSYFNTEVIDPLSQQYLPLLGRAAYDKKAIDAAAAVSKKSTNALEAYLRDTTFLVGERITLADIFAAGIITRGFQFFYGKEWRQENPNITRWFELITNQPIFSAVAEKLEFLETPKLTNVKPAAPKPAPKAAPKPAAAAAEEPVAEEPKAKHPCEALGRPTFPLDEWKRQYSNNETPEAMKFFWEKVPTSEYSIWRVDYKYNDELTLTFMSSNLIGGFNARLEGSRKYLFGCASVFGQNNDSVIQGAFVIRGEEYLPVFDVAPDYESYSFTKLDASKPEDREFVEAQWGWDKPVTVNGKEYAHAAGKVFK